MTDSVKPENNWVVKGLVLVKYPKDDLIGMFFGYYSLIVYQIQAIYITLFLWNRDMMTFYCCFTHLLSEIMNYLLKHALKQPRPNDGAPPGGGLFEGKYGMPSQHCHCFSYLFTTIMLLVFHYYKDHIQTNKKVHVAIISTICLLLQIIGRVYLKFHTINQCLVGVGFGFMSALTFYIIGVNFFIPYADSLCKLWILRQFSFKKDLISLPPTVSSQVARSLNQHQQCKLKNT